MKYALIGCGRIATNHIKAAVNNKLEIAAVCDNVTEKMEELLAKHGLEKDTSIARFTNYKEMFTAVIVRKTRIEMKICRRFLRRWNSWKSQLYIQFIPGIIHVPCG